MQRKNYTYRVEEYPYNLVEDAILDAAEKEKVLAEDAQVIGKRLERAMGMLPERYKKFLKERYIRKLTYKSIGENEGVGGERARQIINKSLRMLRHPVRKKYILEDPKAEWEELK